MTFKRWIQAISVLIVLLLVAIALLFTQQLKLKSDLEGQILHERQSLSVVEELRRSSDDITLAARQYVMTGEKRFKEYFNSMVAIRGGKVQRPLDYDNAYWDFVFAEGAKPRGDSENVISLLERAKLADFSTEDVALIEQSFDNSQSLTRLETEAFYAVEGVFRDDNGNFANIGLSDKSLAQQLLFGDEYLAAKASIMKPITSLAQAITKRERDSAIKIQEQITSTNIGLLVSVLALLVGGALLAYMISRSGRDQIERRAKLQEAAEQENEQLNDSVISILEAVSSLAQKDLTARAPVTEDVIGTVSDSINLLADETSTVLTEVTGIAGQVSIVSDSVYTQAEHVSETAKKERESVQNMIETLFEATQTMNQVAALAEQSNSSAEDATSATQLALETVNTTVVGMESIRETISATEKRIKRLGERSQEISGIVNLINTISERTHVLALNASMQAAVAGEAGRGFAVVAEEVRQLAENSRNATEQIATLVNNIQIETNETINTVNETITQVVEGSEQAQKAGEEMKRTQQITADLVSQVQDIAIASNKQKAMSGDLLEAVQEIGDSTEQTAKQIAAQNASTEELQKAAKSLVDSVSVFTLS